MVWRKGLLIKIKNFGINGHMFEWIADFVTDRTFQVRIGDEHSDIYILENGTSQGSIILPALFPMMINDMPNYLTLLFHSSQMTVPFSNRDQTSSGYRERSKKILMFFSTGAIYGASRSPLKRL